MKRRFARFLFALATAGLWLLLPWLAFECVAIALRWRLEASNPYIAAEKKGDALINADARTATLNPAPAQGMPPAAPLSPKFYLKENASSFAGQFSEIVRSLGRGGARERFHDQFAVLGSTERETAARLLSEWGFAFDARGALREAYGPPSRRGFFRLILGNVTLRFLSGAMFVPMRDFEHALANAGRDAQPATLSLLLSTPYAPELQFNIVVHPEKSMRETFAFLDADPSVFHAPEDAKRAQDSRWATYMHSLRPNFVSDENEHFQTNRLGFRDDETQIPKPAGLYRIVCIGGSTTEEGATNETTYPKLLQARLRAAFPGHPIEVINTGVSGLDTDGHLAKFEQYLQLEPNLILAYEGINGVMDTVKLARTWDSPLWRRVARLSGGLTYLFPDLLLPSMAEMQSSLEDWHLRNLDLITARAACSGVPIAFASMAWPKPEAIPREEVEYFDFDTRNSWDDPALTIGAYARYIALANEMLKTYCRENGLNYIPVAERITSGLPVFGDLCHMTQAGVELKAQAIAEGLIPLLQAHFGAGR